MEYPIVPIALASKSNISKMQIVQNMALKQAVRDTEDRFMTLEDIHEKYEMEAMNVRLATTTSEVMEQVRTDPSRII